MNTKEKCNISGICMKIAKWLLIIANILLFLFIVIGEAVYPDERDMTNTDVRLFETQWYYVSDTGERIPVDVPGKVEAEYGETVTMVTNLPDDITCGESICFKAIWQDVTIYVDDELRTSYSTKDTRPFGTNSAFRYIFVDLTEEDEGKELTYVLTSDSKYTGTFRESYIGDKSSIWTHFINETGGSTIIALFLFLMSLFCIIVCTILRWGYKISLPLNYLAWTLFFCSLWMISEIDFRQVFFKCIGIFGKYILELDDNSVTVIYIY